MDIYYFVIFLTFIIWYCYRVPSGNQTAYLVKVFWVFVPILIYGALRENFGNDYGRYEELYYHYHQGLQNYDSGDHSETGYQLLCYFMPSWRLLLIFVSTSVILGYVVLYSKYVDSKYLVVALFFTFFYPEQTFFLQFISMRNGLTIAGTYLCLPLIVNNRYILVLIIACLLMQIHTSAILFLPLALIVGRNQKLTKPELYIWMGVLFLLLILSNSLLIKIIDPLFAGDAFDSYRENYLSVDEKHSSYLNIFSNSLLIYWILSWAYRRRKELKPYQNVIWRLSLLYLIAPFLGPIGRTRMIYYYIPFYIITITFLVKDKWPVHWQKIAFICIALTVMFYATFVVWLNNPYFRIMHYESIFSD